ncbi:MAG: aldo/keto reductase [Chthoniobacterales bacterium]|nr:aldo/keto reductase [Chthoniobacterales bacterium]
MREEMSRRKAARLIAASAAGLLLSRNRAVAQNKDSIIQRAIPSTGEELPVIGLGTWQAFDVGTSAAEREPLREVLARLVQLGGKLIDSSPMYGRAEAVIGDLTGKLQPREALFLATKVWTTGRGAGIKSMERSLDLLQTKRIDLMQVHNLVDARTHLATLREWKQQGRVRYIGITHYTASSHAEVIRVLEKEPVDFVQINYSLMEREAEDRVLPVARDRGIAVIANRPFGGGGLFGRVRSKPLPDWAAEFDCTSWAQFFLKWIVANPIVTCAIPATSNPRHLEDNMRGGIGRLPDARMRQRIVEAVTAL